MTGTQLQRAIDKLGLSQASFSRLLGVTDRQVRYWIADQKLVPLAVAYLLNLMLDTDTKPEDLRAKG